MRPLISWALQKIGFRGKLPFSWMFMRSFWLNYIHNLLLWSNFEKNYYLEKTKKQFSKTIISSQFILLSCFAIGSPVSTFPFHFWKRRGGQFRVQFQKNSKNSKKKYSQLPIILETIHSKLLKPIFSTFQILNAHFRTHFFQKLIKQHIKLQP